MTSRERQRELDRWLERKLAGELGDSDDVSDEQARRLLAHAGQPLEALARPPAGDPEFGTRLAAALAESGQASPGEAIDPFRIERAIGSGGMGVVYRARRISGGFEQTVALKVLGGARPDEAAMARFERERDLLSRLEHPGIARLIDGGVTEEGRPWFAMEYVEGRPIDAWCRERKLGLRDRISLVAQVCDALDYAHGQMVLHRDIKPANILVDKAGRVRLVDFGLGRIQADLASGTPEITQLSRRWLTPEYASPEQLRGEAVDVRSEVYQTGLVLYRLLCADSPYEVSTESPADWIDAVTRTTPTAPSERWRANSSDAGQFSSTGQALRRRLKGDLDRIVLMALRKEPERRYGSVRTLRDDLDRYLEGRPVEARPDGAAYRMHKFVSRHPWGLAAALAGLVVALGAGFVHVDRLQSERDRARLEANKATMISDFLVDLFESADPEHARGADLTVREVLEQGGRQLQALEDQPAMRADLADVLARVHRALGEYERSSELAEQAVALQRRAHGEGDLRLAQSLHNLGQSLHRLARKKEAERAHRRALQIVQGNEPVSQAALGTAHHFMGVARDAAESYAAALEYFERAVAIRSEAHGEASPQVAQTLNEMAMSHYQSGDYDLARQRMQRALEIFSDELGPDHPTSLQVRSRLASVENHRGNHSDAAVQLTEILEAQRRIHGERHPAVATRLFELGFARYRADEHERAAKAWMESLEIRREIYGEGHPSVARALQALAAVARAGGDLKRSESLLQQVKSIYEAQGRPRSTAVAAVLNNLGTLRADREQHESALQYYRQALEIYREVLGPEHADVASVLHRMGEVNLKLERHDSAADLLARALRMREEVLPADHPRIAQTREVIARLEKDAGAETGL